MKNNTAACLADAILELSSSNNLSKMGEYAKPLSESKHSLQNIAKLIKNVYEILFK